MKTVSIKLDLRLLCAALALVIAGMLVVWQPWDDQSAKKTITVNGQAVIDEEPDQYVFTPSFHAGAAGAAEAVAKVSQKGNEVVQALKGLGLSDDQLTTRVDSNEGGGIEPQIYPPRPGQGGEPYAAYYYIVARVKDKAQAQKITDYLAKNGASGGITPQAEFAQETRAQLDAQIRQKALQDARAKAETEARELGIKLGGVVSVSEESRGGGMMPMDARAEATKNQASPPVLTGTQQVSLSLTVTYAIK